MPYSSCWLGSAAGADGAAVLRLLLRIALVANACRRSSRRALRPALLHRLSLVHSTVLPRTLARLPMRSRR